MDQLAAINKAYRHLPIFKHLLESLEMLEESGLIQLELMLKVIEQYDQTVARLVSQCEDQYTVQGDLAVFRITKDMHLFYLKDVIIKKTGNSALASKRKKKTKRGGKIVCKMNYLKVISLKSSEESGPKVERAVKKKKNPKVKSSAESKDPPKPSSKSFLLPMPYNEKLRLGGRENSRAIAETQVSRLEVLRERFRKEPTEYPYRSVDTLARKTPGDREVVSGPCMLRRSYITLLRTEDRLLAEMAVRAGGSLNLPGHNIHVVPGLSSGQPQVRRSQRILSRLKSENRISPTLPELSINIKLEEEENQKEDQKEDKWEMEMVGEEMFIEQLLEMEMNENPSHFSEQIFDFDEMSLDLIDEPPVQPVEDDIDQLLDSILQYEEEMMATF